MVKKEPIVRKDFTVYGYELLTWQGKFGNNRKAVSLIYSEVEKEKNVRLFINFPPTFVMFMPPDVKQLLLELNKTAPVVIEIIEVEPYTPDALPVLPFPYSLDDWGTGYSNLEVLIKILKLPNFRYVKIDRKIFAPLLKTKEGRKFLSSLTEFLHAGGKVTIFEKVENRKEFEELSYLSPENTLFQGFYVMDVLRCSKGTGSRD